MFPALPEHRARRQLGASSLASPTRREALPVQFLVGPEAHRGRGYGSSASPGHRELLGPSGGWLCPCATLRKDLGPLFPAAGPGGAPSGRCRGSPWGRPRSAQLEAGPRWASGDRYDFYLFFAVLGSWRELPRSLFTRGENKE